jgi:RNA polymerase sigma-70 factor (ECF subfamily)
MRSQVFTVALGTRQTQSVNKKMTPQHGHRGAEEPLLPEIASGDRAAVAECIDRYGPLVWSMARRLSPTAEDAEDAVQEIFLDVWRYASRFDAARGSEKAFVGILARRKLIDRMRRQKFRLGSEQPLDETHEVTLAGALHAEQDAEMDAVRAVLVQLTLPQRRVLELSLVQGMSHAEIVAHTGLPLGTVKTLIRRGILHARNLLGNGNGNGNGNGSGNGNGNGNGNGAGSAKAAGEKP